MLRALILLFIVDLSLQLRVPKPPADPQKPKSATRVYVRKTRPPDEVGRKVLVTVARPLPPDAASQLLDYTGNVMDVTPVGIDILEFKINSLR